MVGHCWSDSRVNTNLRLSESLHMPVTPFYVYLSDPDTLTMSIQIELLRPMLLTNLVDFASFLENINTVILFHLLRKNWLFQRMAWPIPISFVKMLRVHIRWWRICVSKAQDLWFEARGRWVPKSIVQSSIKGLDAYVKGESKDFQQLE